MLDDNDQQNNRIDDIVNDVTVRALRGVRVLRGCVRANQCAL